MPQLRSFGAFAPAPQLAQSYATGVKLTQEDQQRDLTAMLEREKMANQYNIASMETATRREALAQEALAKKQALDAESAMFAKRMTAQQEQLAQEAMLKNQELEIEKFYKTGMLGISTRGVQVDEQKQNMAATEAAREYDVQRRLKDRITQLVVHDELDPQDANKQAMEEFRAELPVQLQTQMMREQSSAPSAPSFATVGNDPSGDYRALWTGQTWNLVDTKKKEQQEIVAKPVPNDPSRDQIAGRVVPSYEWNQAKQLEKDATKLEDQLLNGDAWAPTRSFMNRDPKTWSKQVQSDVANYKRQLFKVDNMRNEAERIKAKRSKSSGTDGAVKRGKYTLTPVGK